MVVHEPDLAGRLLGATVGAADVGGVAALVGKDAEVVRAVASPI